MAGSITDLVNSIKDSVDGLLNKQTQVTSLYPTDKDYTELQSQFINENWLKLSFPYTFSILNIKTGQNSPSFKDFALPLSPQAISQREIPAISIKPSQGGTTVNHSGIGYKTLNIQGTTGIAPFRGEGGVERATGEAIFQPKDLKHKSGYEVFNLLRNWFKTYYQWKKVNGKSAQDYRLVFKNYKDGEWLIVELEGFEMDRSAAKPFSYDYKMEFKVLSHFTFSTPESKLATDFFGSADKTIQAALDGINKARGVFLRTQGILRQIESTYEASVLEPIRQTSLAIKALLGVPLVAADIGSRTIVNTVSTAGALAIVGQEALNTATLGLTGNSQTIAEIDGLLDKRLFGTKNTLKKTIDATISEIKHKGSGGLTLLGGLLTKIDAGQFSNNTLSAVAIEQTKALSLPRNYYEKAIESLERVKQNAEDFVNLGSTDYDTIFDRTATLTADITKVVTDDEYDLLNAFNDALVSINLLLSTDTLFKNSFDEQITDMVTRFNGNIELQASPAVRQTILTKGMSLERLAQIELGDSTRWGEIVEANSLKAPYISEDPQESRDGVLGPGMKILIPDTVRNGFSQVPNGKGNKLTKDLSEVERNLGVDLRINEEFDLILSASGDLELIAGTQNMAQAIVLKLNYEPGELMVYPELGAGLIVGKKFPPILEIKDKITNTLLQDTRVSKISNLALMRDGSSLSVTFELFIKQVDLPIPIKIKI